MLARFFRVELAQSKFPDSIRVYPRSIGIQAIRLRSRCLVMGVEVSVMSPSFNELSYENVFISRRHPSPYKLNKALMVELEPS